MAILAFQKPDKVIMIHSTDIEGQFEFRPLEPGYGVTVGNALRRILLSSLEGHAITGIRIEGVDHEFSTIKGIVEDVTEIVLNLKQVRFKKQIEGVDTEKVTISLNGKDEFTAGDIAKGTSAFQVLNPDHVICVGKGVAEIVKKELETLFPSRHTVFNQPNTHRPVKMSLDEFRKKQLENFQMYHAICNPRP